ncbi:MAG: hypothetical protein HY400_01065 [Elusimicrobia bacterium]|nr:hypothetical protein [Elusimicrobiota bacterium]
MRRWVWTSAVLSVCRVGQAWGAPIHESVSAAPQALHGPRSSAKGTAVSVMTLKVVPLSQVRPVFEEKEIRDTRTGRRLLGILYKPTFLFHTTYP